MVISTTRPRSSPLGSDPCISGAAACVGPMIKFPSLSAGGTSPSGNSFAFTYPAVCGSRVGGVGLTYVCGAGAAVCAPNTALIPTASKASAAADITRLIANSLASTVANDRPPRVATPPGTPPSARSDRVVLSFALANDRLPQPRQHSLNSIPTRYTLLCVKGPEPLPTNTAPSLHHLQLRPP